MSDQAKMGLTWASPLQQARNAANEKPKREWQGLTDEEQLEIMKQFGLGQRALFADAIEAKLKEKNT